jgi:hypothetical protein
MADSNQDRERQARVPAYALLRAAVLQDSAVAVHLVAEAQAEGRLPDLVFAVAHLAARAMLATEGYDTAKVLRIVDGWLETAAHGVPGPQGRPGAAA